MSKTEIVQIKGNEVLDSKGNPAIAVHITLSDGSTGYGIAPNSIPRGSNGTWERKDYDKRRYGGKGVLSAVELINKKITKLLIGTDVKDLYHIDTLLKTTDSTPDKKKLGVNTTLALSIACAKAAASSYGLPLYEFLGGISGNTLPVPIMNLISGGIHTSNNIDIQEFMIMPVGALNFQEGLRYCTETYHALETLLNSQKNLVGFGDEGGFAPNLSKDTEALDYIVAAIKAAGYEPKKDICIALDCAAWQWKEESTGKYHLPKGKTQCETSDLIDYYSLICDQYPIVSLENPLGEEDWVGWQELTSLLGNRVQLIGDKQGISLSCGNSILINPSQIGTLTETMDVIKSAKKNGYTTIASHGACETEDTFLSDLAVGLNTGQIKAGAPARSGGTAKYNRLLYIEQTLGESGHYPGHYCLPNCSGR